MAKERKYRLSKRALVITVLLVILIATGLDKITGEVHLVPVPSAMVAPFILLLLSIAVMPFINGHWWERNYPLVSLGLAVVTICCYVIFLGNVGPVIHSANEYFSFIALVGSLFVVSGGIHIHIRGRATPHANVALLAAGAIIANILGTTGASMLLIRPYIRTNKYRISAYHIIFFIFIISNMGGMLTPIGDPPLFLGYLKGVPFFWVIARIWPIWFIANGLVLLIFYFIDRSYYKKLPDELEHEIEEEGEKFSITGLKNCFYLAIIICAVFLPRPLREIVMFCTALVSCLTTNYDIHDKNDFNFAPVKEVVILFAGIFATMTPVMGWLEMNASSLGITTPAQFYWGSGILSSFLDNAPTYLNFLSAACGLHGLNIDNPSHVHALIGISPANIPGVKQGLLALSGDSWKYVLAISAASVIFGANTYIGNGPNFMVKAIAEQSRIRMPSFFGYIFKYSIPILLPLCGLLWIAFFS